MSAALWTASACNAPGFKKKAPGHLSPKPVLSEMKGGRSSDAEQEEVRGGFSQEKPEELAELWCCRRGEVFVVLMWELDALRGVMQPWAWGKRWWYRSKRRYFTVTSLPVGDKNSLSLTNPDCAHFMELHIMLKIKSSGKNATWMRLLDPDHPLLQHWIFPICPCSTHTR